MLRLAMVTAAVLLGSAGTALAGTYYVSPDGSDAGPGSATQPWRSVSRVNEARLQPGDTVLFRGGATFRGALEPSGSGRAGAPISFGSYGSGAANVSGGIELVSQRFLSFSHLKVDTGAWRTSGTTRGVTTSSSGSGVTDITVRDCTFANLAIGMMLSNHRDEHWWVSGNTIRWTRDSGILIYDPTARYEVGGGHMTFTGNRILDTGLDKSLDYKKHGVYDIGHDIVWRNNTIARFSEGGFSLRARGNTLVGNHISNGPYAIYYSPYDPKPAMTRIVSNTITNVTQGTITIDSSGEVANHQSYLISGNRISGEGEAPGIRILGTSGKVTIVDNKVSVGDAPPLRIDRMPGGGLTETGNQLWSRSMPVAIGWLGRVFSSVGGYRTASGRGVGDTFTDPHL
jgi:hypothetical protein